MTRPPAPLERLGVLDVLRGIALLGMYVVHLHNYSATPAGAGDAGAFERVLDEVVSLFFDGRFYTMFGMLFGVGFAVQLARADARGEPFVARYLRRLLLLAVFGFIAEGIFGYNVLFAYAAWGAPLLLVRRWSTRALVVLLVLSAASLPIYNLGRIAWYSAQPDGMARFQAANQERNERFQAARAELDEAEKSPDFRTVAAARVRFMPKFQRQWNLLPWGAFTLFLLGMIGFRLGLFDRPGEHRRAIIALMVFGAASWAMAWWVFPIGGRPPPAPSAPGFGAVVEAVGTIARSNGFRLIRDQWLAFTYVGGILLLVAGDRAWLHRLAPLAWAGRMALTNYMSQVILLDVLFEAWGAGLTVTPVMVPAGALALFGAQSVAARWWLARFQAGPLEWIWRCFTYWKWQPLRRSGYYAPSP
ncbi:MAG TPA: DUF418 domain-containing protein [Gemmatimonadales bacterium]